MERTTNERTDSVGRSLTRCYSISLFLPYKAKSDSAVDAFMVPGLYTLEFRKEPFSDRYFSISYKRFTKFNQILKELHNEYIAPILTDIFGTSLSEGTIPKDWKKRHCNTCL